MVQGEKTQIQLFAEFPFNSSFIIKASFDADVVTIQANYMLAMGPLMTAIMVWKNSLVFHSLDKLTSMYDIIRC